MKIYTVVTHNTDGDDYVTLEHFSERPTFELSPVQELYFGYLDGGDTRRVTDNDLEI